MPYYMVLADIAWACAHAAPPLPSSPKRTPSDSGCWTAVPLSHSLSPSPIRVSPCHARTTLARTHAITGTVSGTHARARARSHACVNNSLSSCAPENLLRLRLSTLARTHTCIEGDSTSFQSHHICLFPCWIVDSCVKVG